MTPDRPDLDALEQLANAATPAPWEAHADGDIGPNVFTDCLCFGRRTPENHTQHLADAQFIAAARTALPARVAEVRRLEQIGADHAALDADWVAKVEHLTRELDDQRTIAEVATRAAERRGTRVDCLHADNESLRAELAAERDAHHTTSDAAVAYMREIDTLREHQRAANQREDDMRAELLAERDAHHATCDALARERAEVARLQAENTHEAITSQARIAAEQDANRELRGDIERIREEAAADRLDAAKAIREMGEMEVAHRTVEREVERLRGLLDRACDAAEELLTRPSDYFARIRTEGGLP